MKRLGLLLLVSMVLAGPSAAAEKPLPFGLTVTIPQTAPYDVNFRTSRVGASWDYAVPKIITIYTDTAGVVYLTRRADDGAATWSDPLDVKLAAEENGLESYVPLIAGVPNIIQAPADGGTFVFTSGAAQVSIIAEY